MSESEECIVTGGMMKVLRLSRIFGIAPICITPAGVSRSYSTGTVKCYKVSISKRYGIISSTCIFVIWLTGFVTYAFVNNVMDPEKAIRIRTGLSLVLFNMHRISHDMILFYVIFRGLNKMKNIIRYINNIEKLNQALNNSYENININKSDATIWSLVSSLYIISLIYICQRILDVIYGEKSVTIVVMQTIYFLTFNMYVLMQLQFTFVVYLLNATIYVFNDRLQSWNSKWDYEINHIIVHNKKYIPFRRLCKIYVSIYKLITKIDKEEGVFVVILIIYKILDMLDSLYLIVSSLAYLSLGNVMYASIVDFVVELIWIIYRGVTLVLLMESCNQTDVKLQALKLQVSHMICKTNEHYGREKLFTFSRQLIIDLPVFSPLGVCSLRRKELIAIISVLFTFVVILRQFRLRDGMGY